MARCYDGQFQWQQHTGNELIEEDRFILSRTSVAVDGNFKCIITVDQKSGLELIVFGPRHVPYDIEEGHWHLTQLPQTETEAYRLCSNVFQLVEYPRFAVFTNLICDDTLTADVCVQMNNFEKQGWTELRTSVNKLRWKYC